MKPLRGLRAEREQHINYKWNWERWIKKNCSRWYVNIYCAVTWNVTTQNIRQIHLKMRILRSPSGKNDCAINLKSHFFKYKTPLYCPTLCWPLQHYYTSTESLPKAGHQYNASSMICESSPKQCTVWNAENSRDSVGIIILIYTLYLCHCTDQRWQKDKDLVAQSRLNKDVT